MLSLLHVPSGTFRAKESTNDQGDRRNEGRAKLEAPGDIANLTDNKVGTCSQEDTKGSPDLPRHDKTTSNSGRGVLSSVDRNSHFFQTHTDTEEHTNRHMSSWIKDQEAGMLTYRQAASCPQV